MTFGFFFLICLAEFCAAAMHVLFKKSVNSLETGSLKNFSDYLAFFKLIFKSPTIWMGLFSIACGMTIWLRVLANVDLSLAFSLSSIQYILILVVSVLVFKEPFRWDRVLGTFLVIAGILLVAWK